MKSFYATILAAFVATATAYQYSQCCTPGCGYCDIMLPCGEAGTVDCSQNIIYTVCCALERKGRTEPVNITNTAKD